MADTTRFTQPAPEKCVGVRCDHATGAVFEVPICAAPCHYGGLSAARKYSRSELGWMWHCNRRVNVAGQRCYQHRDG